MQVINTPPRALERFVTIGTEDTKQKGTGMSMVIDNVLTAYSSTTDILTSVLLPVYLRVVLPPALHQSFSFCQVSTIMFSLPSIWRTGLE